VLEHARQIAAIDPAIAGRDTISGRMKIPNMGAHPPFGGYRPKPILAAKVLDQA
jgi:hypothetical protein